MTLLEIKGLGKKFGGLKAVDNLTFSILEREIVGLIGPNGAGKTTVFNLITGVYSPDDGIINLEDRDITGLKPHMVCRTGIGRTFQVTKPFNDLSTLDNVIVGCYLKSNSKKAVRKKAEEILNFVGLFEKRFVKAKHLTLAERKLLEIARSLSSDPKLLLLDEVMSGLNERETDNAINLIDKIRKMKISLLVIEHIFKVILNLADRVVVLDQGRKIAEDQPENVVKDENVIKAYFGDEYVFA